MMIPGTSNKHALPAVMPALFTDLSKKIVDGSGQLFGAVTTFSDVTAQREVERERQLSAEQDARHQAEQAVRILGVFERFHQAHPEGHYGGMGLGLYEQDRAPELLSVVDDDGCALAPFCPVAHAHAL